jgi:hypothetical protein
MWLGVNRCFDGGSGRNLVREHCQQKGHWKEQIGRIVRRRSYYCFASLDLGILGCGLMDGLLPLEEELSRQSLDHRVTPKFQTLLAKLKIPHFPPL